MRQTRLTVLCLDKAHTVKLNRPFLTHAVRVDRRRGLSQKHVSIRFLAIFLILSNSVEIFAVTYLNILRCKQ